jgi:molybdate-binding protein
LFDGSMDGLQRFARRESALTGLHVNSGERWNVDAIGEMGLSHCVLLHWAKRQQGFMHRSDAVDLAKATTAISDGRFALRQPGAGARQLLENLLARSAGGLPKLQSNAVYRTETEAAAAVASGEADVALGLEAAARQFKLAFSPVVREQFDLLFDQRAYFSVSVQRLVRFCQSGTFRSKAASLGGYDLTDAWQVRWLSN